MAELTHAVRARIQAILGDAVSSHATVARGYTPAARWVVTLRSGSSVFVKMGTTALTADMLRLEARVYRSLAAPFIPKLIAWDDDPSEPLLMLEDLSASFWPPPWSPPLVGEVQKALAALHRTYANLPTFAEVNEICPRVGGSSPQIPSPF